MKSLPRYLLVLALFALSACGGADVSNDRSTVLHRAISTDPESLDIHKARSQQALDVLRDLGEGLVTNTATGELTPGVAESWEISSDGLRYTFHLRADAKWSNGEPRIQSSSASQPTKYDTKTWARATEIRT